MYVEILKKKKVNLEVYVVEIFLDILYGMLGEWLFLYIFLCNRRCIFLFFILVLFGIVKVRIIGLKLILIFDYIIVFFEIFLGCGCFFLFDCWFIKFNREIGEEVGKMLMLIGNEL